VPSAPPGSCRPFDRADALARLEREQFDVLVVGGGITGAGVALDAAARGLRTALVERADFASGTSSQSSKLVHGGLRYLQQGDVRLVAEALLERQRLLRNAPHLVAPLPFLIPLFGRNGVVSATVARSYATALWLYDLAGGWRIGHRHRRVDRHAVLAHLPRLRTDRLVTGFLYFDARTDDARLTLAVLRTAACDFGAAVANYAEVTGLLRADGSSSGPVVGARVALRGPGETDELAVQARVVVNATGVWTDQVRMLDEGPHVRTTRPAKGVHVTVPADRLPADIAAVLPVPGDRRSIFVVPWGDSPDTYIGTTDTDWDGDLDHPDGDSGDVDYLLGAVNAATTAGLGREDVTGVWAGLRPLVDAPSGSSSRSRARTADLSRRHQVLASPAGVVTVTGGKLTTYRLMAQHTVDAVVRRLGTAAAPGARRCPTRRLALRGAPGTAPVDAAHRPDPSVADPTPAPAGRRPGSAEQEASALAALERRHGTEARSVLALAAGRPDLLEPLVPGLPYLRVEVLWASRHEMALTVDDVLTRRTRTTLRRAAAAVAAAPDVGRLLAEATGRPVEAFADDVDRYRAAVRQLLERAGVAGSEDALR
jgi:glycerol-3-phosphate dehydrogenase